jgi:hypothetical protein
MRPPAIRRRAPATLMACVTALLAGVSSAGQAAQPWQDTLELRDGTIHTGVVSLDGDHVLISTAVGQHRIAISQVAQIQSADHAATDKLDEDRVALESLRRASDAFARAADGVRRYEQFIRQFAGSSAAVTAQVDLAIWQDRHARNLTKVATRWLDNQEAASSRLISDNLVELAVGMIALGQYADADRTLADAASAAGGPAELSVRGQFLAAITHWHLGSYPKARTAYDLLIKARPEDPLVRHNLAVIMWRQNQTVAAATQLERALAKFPDDRLSAFQQSLDNAAELINLLETSEKPSAARDNALRRLRARFESQDAKLAVTLAAQGFARWGGSYIPLARREELRRIADAARQTVTDINTRLAAAEARVGEIDRRINDNTSEMRRLEARSYYRTADGQLLRQAMPSVYGELQIDNDRLTNERAIVMADAARFRQDLAAAAAQMPTPTFSGQLVPFGLEAAPTLDAVLGTNNTGQAPTSQPQ